MSKITACLSLLSKSCRSYLRMPGDFFFDWCLFVLLGLSLLSCQSSQNRICLSTGFGEIIVEVYPEKAPVTAHNFLKYVDEGRFKKAVFYRVVTPANQPNNNVKIEVIQGGLLDDDHVDRLESIVHETTDKTGLKHLDGTISMARSVPGSASSEFFICIGDQPELDYGGRRNSDGQGFAAFGKVIKGMEVVKQIQSQPEENQMLKNKVEMSISRW